MAKKSEVFNLSATIREFQKSHRGVPATAALAAVTKAHPKQKINEGTFSPPSISWSAVGGRRP